MYYEKDSIIEDRLFCQFRDEGNNQSFEKLYRLVRPWLYRIIYRIIGDYMSTEDILHNTWIKVIERGYQFEPIKGRFRNYIFSIGKNEALIWKAGNNKIKQAISDYANELDTNDIQQPDRSLEISQNTGLIQKILKKLNSDQQECILLYYFAGHSVKEISEMLSKPEGQVKSLLSRGREKLKSILSLPKYADSIFLFSFLG
jgi:RNA polymerase sigma-70 factor, ECF subfamily